MADANDGFNFEQATADLRSLIPANLMITQVNRGRLDPEMGSDGLNFWITLKNTVKLARF